MQDILEDLYQGKNLNKEKSKKLFIAIIEGFFCPEQIAAILISMKIKGEKYEEIAGAASAILAKTMPFSRPNYLFADITGTGGDNSNSINISTVSAIVAAGCNIKISKHINSSISSKTGSADLLKSFGFDLNYLALNARKHLDAFNLCFLFAPYYHKSFSIVMPIRKILKTRTIFNILGPLVNPSRPELALIGVHSEELMLPFAKTLQILGYKRAIIVYGSGIDEVVLHAPNKIIELHNNEINNYILTIKDFGISKRNIVNNINGGNPIENCNIITSLLKGKGNKTHSLTVAANVALLLKLFGKENLRENTQQALDEIYSGASYKRLISLLNEG